MPDFLRRLTPWQASLWLIAMFSLVRLAVGASSGLSEDEAHYALYGLHLDWSYFDHPPLVGWLQALALRFSDTSLALRVIPVLLFAATGMVLYRLTLALFPEESPWVAFVSVAVLQSGLMFQLIGSAMLPDTPLLLFGLLVLLALQQVLASGKIRHWLLLGLLLGLAGLSKYTAVTLIITVLAALAFTRQWRQLLTAGPWLALITGLLCITPVLYWNAQHDWISFAYQLHHGTGNLDWQPFQFLQSEIAQLLAYGFAVVVFGLAALITAVREPTHPGVRYLLALALPVLLLFGWNSGYVLALPHWTSLGWAALTPLAARWIIRRWDRRYVRIGFYASAVWSMLLMLVLFSEMITPRLPFPDNQNPMSDLFGWKMAAVHAVYLRNEMAATPGEKPLLFIENWSHASLLAWYARPSPVIVIDNRYDQFDLWFGSPENGERGILVVPNTDEKPETGGKGQFSDCTLHDKLPIVRNGHLISTFAFYACNDFHK